MPNAYSSRVPPPANWQDFEKIVRDVMQIMWKEPEFQLIGRIGQKQDGVDIFGKVKRKNIGIQCKNFKSTICRKDISKEIKKADKFRPKLNKYIIATTLERDAKVQKIIREMNENRREKGKYPVSIMFWDDIYQELTKVQNVHEKYYQFALNHNRKVELEESNKSIRAISILELSYMGLYLGEYIDLIFGFWGVVTGENPQQIKTLVMRLKHHINNCFDKSKAKILGEKMDSIEKLCLKRFIDNEKSEERWKKVYSLSEQIINSIYLLKESLEKEELIIFKLGDVLGYLNSPSSVDKEYTKKLGGNYTNIRSYMIKIKISSTAIYKIDEIIKEGIKNDSFSNTKIPSEIKFIIKNSLEKMRF